jgi:hypothetical protein
LNFSNIRNASSRLMRERKPCAPLWLDMVSDYILREPHLEAEKQRVPRTPLLGSVAFCQLRWFPGRRLTGCGKRRSGGFMPPSACCSD